MCMQCLEITQHECQKMDFCSPYSAPNRGAGMRRVPLTLARSPTPAPALERITVGIQCTTMPTPAKGTQQVC